MTASAVYTFDTDTISDLHKDSYGFRPSSQYFTWFKSATDDEKQAEWDRLIVVMTRREEMRREDEVAAIERFEQGIASTITSGAADRSTAIQWLIQAEGNINGDIEYFEYLQGIPYGYINKTTIGVTA